MSLAVLCMSVLAALTVRAGACMLDEFDVVAGLERVCSNGWNTTIHMDPPDQGVRMDARIARTAGSVCGDVYGRSQPGAVFALYVTTGEPIVRTPGAPGFEPWWELDFEFLGKAPDKVWVNSFVAGRPSGPGYVALPRPVDAGFSRYCLAWNVSTGNATWTVDAKRVWASTAMKGAGAMRPIVSFWTGTGESASWAGGNRVQQRVSMVIRNYVYS